MRFINKSTTSDILVESLSYDHVSDRPRISEILKSEQKSYCAYTEMYIDSELLHASEIEHFDPRKKHTSSDSYHNWHLVPRWINIHKRRKIDLYLPILDPGYSSTSNRITYEEHIYHGQDEMAINLIEFLGLNREEVYKARLSHINRLRHAYDEFLTGDFDRFINYLRIDPNHLSYPTAIEYEFRISLSRYFTNL